MEGRRLLAKSKAAAEAAPAEITSKP